MIATIYTYRNRKVVLVQRPEFYFLKDKQDYDKLVDSLLDIDATSSPSELKFPCVLRLETGFAPNLVETSVEEYEKAIKNHEDFIHQHQKHLQLYKNEVIKMAQQNIKEQQRIIKEHKK